MKNYSFVLQTKYRRCYNPTATSDDEKVICRLGNCQDGEEWVNSIFAYKFSQTFTFFQLNTANQAVFSDATSCDSFRFMARPCYVATPLHNTDGFTIVPVWDWQPDGCQSIGKLLTSEWFYANSTSDVDEQTTAYYTEVLPLRHDRCAGHGGKIICRPVLEGNLCGFGELKVVIEKTPPL